MYSFKMVNICLFIQEADCQAFAQMDLFYNIECSLYNDTLYVIQMKSKKP